VECPFKPISGSCPGLFARVTILPVTRENWDNKIAKSLIRQGIEVHDVPINAAATSDPALLD